MKYVQLVEKLKTPLFSDEDHHGYDKRQIFFEFVEKI